MSLVIVAIGAIAFTAIAVAGVAASKRVRKSDPRAHLQQLGAALMMYAQDYGDMLPPMKDARAVRRLLGCYLKDESAFFAPDTKKPFLPNTHLSGRTLNSIFREGYNKRQGIIAFYEAAPRANGAHLVLRMAKPHSYANGQPVWAYAGKNSTLWQPTVESVSQRQWPQAKKASNID